MKEHAYFLNLYSLSAEKKEQIRHLQKLKVCCLLKVKKTFSIKKKKKTKTTTKNLTGKSDFVMDFLTLCTILN